ncbi:MAG: hypothetical protein LC798_12975 [Chloroflexi bacterium]|nr:hypothetical protein [Chloroflexota bacterium]
MTEGTEWRRTAVIEALRRAHKQGVRPTFQALDEVLAIGHADLVDEIAELADEGLVEQAEDGALAFTGDEADIPVLEAPEPEVEIPAVIRPEPDHEPEEHEPGAEPEARYLQSDASISEREELGLPAGTVSLTTGMVKSLDAAALGGLIQAGITESAKARKPFVLVVR